MTPDTNDQQNPVRVALSLGALGIVYGDIGTSPLYAFRQSLHNLPINLPDVLGILSLIFWALLSIVTIKYLCIVLRADNGGEGGILALMALLKKSNRGRKASRLLLLIGILGSGLMLGDGMITPAISVVSAVDGLRVINPEFGHLVLPIACSVLFLLFLFQYLGTAKIGITFGPIMLIWFCILGILGISQIVHHPEILKAMNPYYAIEFLVRTGARGYALLGGVFLVLTGAEALYADLGHFGRLPIQRAWFSVVLPALLLNYFGQAGYVLSHPAGISNPFYLIAPHWFFIPLLVIATIATVIASQAVISATFSLMKQAVSLGLYPRLPIIQTSEAREGQIYIPQMNKVLAFGTILLVLTFQSSTALGHAYGVAVNLVMLLTTLLITWASFNIWQWHKGFSVLFAIVFLSIDLLFLGSNLLKLKTGGWIPVSFALFCAMIMYTWHKGMAFLQRTYYSEKDKFSKTVKQLNYKDLNVLRTISAIFVTDFYDQSGRTFLRYLKLNHAIPENIVIVRYHVRNEPYVKLTDRFELEILDHNICELTLHYGFMDFVSIPHSLRIANDKNILPFPIDVSSVTYLIEGLNLVASKEKKTLWFFWQEKLFAFLMRNYSANINIGFFQLPYNRTIAIGSYLMI